MSILDIVLGVVLGILVFEVGMPIVVIAFCTWLGINPEDADTPRTLEGEA
jgi:hypothetical protein